MSIFKADGIVLQVIKLSEKELMYKVLFRDYGILQVKKRKKTREKPIDIGYLISSEIITRNEQNIHTVWNIKILHFFETTWRNYHDIERFLKILSLVQKELPPWSPHYEMYDIFSILIKNPLNSTSHKLLLTQLKLIQCLGNLPEKHNDITTQKVLKFLHTHHFKDILRLGTIPIDTQKKLEQML